MSDLEALHVFVKRPVSEEMIQFLVDTTNSVITLSSCPDHYPTDGYHGYLTPPSTPPLSSVKSSKIPSLFKFIEHLIKYSHVPTSTLMSSLVYLTRLRQVLPPNSVGMESTRHRIFLGALILAAKSLNDSSPLNKHWCKYTDGLLTLNDVNALELDMIEYLGWDNLTISNDDLVKNLSHFLEPIKWKLRHERELKLSEARAAGFAAADVVVSAPLASPTEPLFAHSNSSHFSIPHPTYCSGDYIPSPTSSVGTSSSVAPMSVDSSMLSVPSLASSSSTTSDSTISSILTDSLYSKSPKLANIAGISLKPLRLKGYVDSLSNKENNYKLSADYSHQPRMAIESL
ncbi:hypothetical protein FOA43_001260 [Brettanomyces nanus]|uniref:Cyclin N-terminal domain-containing protein n=1 Tax=Eeniella nana TaxID=13502 RepID=A0A875S0T8_EENNA|nr:uncharacterized protein FOA43_001260 [Brettanomyces nanus]QPG73945.1 hypothetical protein FOA43_001260 [Brettanomyces nanus]